MRPAARTNVGSTEQDRKKRAAPPRCRASSTVQRKSKELLD